MKLLMLIQVGWRTIVIDGELEKEAQNTHNAARRNLHEKHSYSIQIDVDN